MTFYFIGGEPTSVLTMVNMAYVIRKIYPDCVVEAIVPYHSFLAKMDAKEFLDEFDKVWYLPTCTFQRNIFKGFFRGWAFKKAMKRIVFKENSTAFAFISMEMSVNLVIKYIAEKHKSIKVVLLNQFSKKIDINAFGGRFSWLLTLFNRFYSFMFGCYPMKSYINTDGQLMYCKHSQDLPFPKILLLANEKECNNEPRTSEEAQITLPYPIVMRNRARLAGQEKIVIFFGECTLPDYYAQLDKQFLITKTTEYVNAIRDYYAKKNIKVFYKPHPGDGGRIMEGCESAGFLPFKERLNAEMIFSKYQDDIIAAYAVSSNSAPSGSKYGIPAYWAYEVCFSDEDLKRSFHKFVLENNNNLLKKLTSFDQIGSIDECKEKIDTNKIISVWTKGIQGLDLLYKND